MVTKGKNIATFLELFFSEIKKPRALICGMYRLFVDFYQVCMPLGSKLAPHLWGHKLKHRNNEGKVQNSPFLKLEGLEFGIWYLASPCEPVASFSLFI